MSAGPWIDADAHRDDLPAPASQGGDATCGTVVIGGGISGLSIARQLAQQGEDVLLVESTRLGHGASGRNAGFLLADGARSFAHLARARGTDVATSVRALGLGTRAVVHDLAGRHERIGLVPCGSLRLAGDAREAAELEQTAAAVGTGMRYLPAAALPAPWRRNGRFHGGLEDPGDGLLDPLALVHAMRRELVVAGGRVVEETPVLEVHEDDDGVTCRTDSGVVRATRAVLATNAWTRRLAPAALRPVRAQMLEATVDPMPDWPQAMYANGGADYWRRRDAAHVLVGGQRAVGGEAEETDAATPGSAVQSALDALLAHLVGETARTRVTRRWAGIMAFTPDGLPLAGRAPDAARIYMLAGLNGQGMGWAPGLAVLLAEAMAGRSGVLPDCFAPSRFGDTSNGDSA
ncbi:MAG: FAD-dependent oxidoreductase [Planctomycetota bacterium]|nr:FAD-dependent oxidoreductase [Planctomycetota bacterium]